MRTDVGWSRQGQREANGRRGEIRRYKWRPEATSRGRPQKWDEERSPLESLPRDACVPCMLSGDREKYERREKNRQCTGDRRTRAQDGRSEGEAGKADPDARKALTRQRAGWSKRGGRDMERNKRKEKEEMSQESSAGPVAGSLAPLQSC